jgi:hypothetical protein
VTWLIKTRLWRSIGSDVEMNNATQCSRQAFSVVIANDIQIPLSLNFLLKRGKQEESGELVFIVYTEYGVRYGVTLGLRVA